jgi:ABC-type Mn2+/Zn2+ transport system permease subunit
MDWLTDPARLPTPLGGAWPQCHIAAGIWVVVRDDVPATPWCMGGPHAIATLVGFDPAIGAAIAAVVMIGGIRLVHRQTAFSEDTGIGLLFVGMLGLGVILISRTASYTGSLTAILFGNAFGVTGGDLLWLGVVALVTVAGSLLFYRRFLVLSFNEQKAQLLGLRPGLSHGVLLALTTLAIIGSSRTVGTLLVLGLMVAPPATAALLVRRVPAMMGLSVAIGIGAVAAGLVVSYHAGTSGSATMAVLPVALFFVVLTARTLANGHRERATAHR